MSASKPLDLLRVGHRNGNFVGLAIDESRDAWALARTHEFGGAQVWERQLFNIQQVRCSFGF
jgi:hypothetical protein